LREIKHVSSEADNSMKPVRAMANIQNDAVPVGHHRTWVLAFVMPPLQYKSIVTTILHCFGRRMKC